MLKELPIFYAQSDAGGRVIPQKGRFDLTPPPVTVPNPEPDSIVIDGPEYLEPEQNFYDQSPFREVMDQTAQQSGLPIPVLRSALSKVRPGEHVSDRSEWRKMHRQLIPGSSPKDTQGFKVTIRAMGQSLEEYPYIREYMGVAGLSYADYFTNGDPKQSRGNFKSKIPSYGKWVSDRLKAEQQWEQNKVLLGMEEIFPETGSPAEEARATGHKASWRRYTVLKVSEMIREER